jgi:hypothetical protein
MDAEDRVEGPRSHARCGATATPETDSAHRRSLAPTSYHESEV